MATEVDNNHILQHLVQQFGVEQDEIIKMLPAFYTAVLEYQDNLSDAIQSKDMEQISRAAHRLKGALLNLGLSSCAEHAYSIEKSAILLDANFDFQALSRCLDHNLESLRQHI